MAFGYQQQPRTMVNNSAVLTATIYYADDETLVTTGDIDSVTFTILRPGDDPEAPTVDGDAGTVIEDGTAIYQVDPSVNTVEGDYKAIATFVYTDGSLGLDGLTKSVMVDYKVDDPFVRTGPSPADGAVRQAWMFLEDCFDSEQGGPWLRDMTLAVFDQTKLRGLLPQVLMKVNGQMPFTDYTEASFPYTLADGQALLALGLLCEAERQLMRGYTEQPDVVSSPVAFEDRKRYQQAWGVMYALDNKEFTHWLNRWKLRGYDLSSGSLLIGSKAGRMLPAPLRSRNVGRGF